jgi:hypothetical protein
MHSSIRQRRKPQKEVWSGTILEVLENPDKDIDIVPPPPAASVSAGLSLSIHVEC